MLCSWQSQILDMFGEQFNIAASMLTENMTVFFQVADNNRIRLVNKGDGNQLGGTIFEIDIPVKIWQIDPYTECVQGADHRHFCRSVADVDTAVQRFIKYAFLRIIEWGGQTVIGNEWIGLELFDGQAFTVSKGNWRRCFLSVPASNPAFLQYSRRCWR